MKETDTLTGKALKHLYEILSENSKEEPVYISFFDKDGKWKTILIKDSETYEGLGQ